MPFPPLVTPPSRPIDVDERDTFVVPATFGTMAGHGRARDAVTRGWARPADVDRAEIGPVERVFVPLWRFEGSADGFHVGLTTMPTGRGRPAVLPTGGFRHHDGEILVLARAHLAIDPSAKVRIARSDMVALRSEDGAQNAIDDHERVLPDVPREEAEETARASLRRRGEPHAALYAKVDVRIRAAALVYYPLYVVRYRYAGEATGGVEGLFHAAISARTGELASAEHPSALKSLAGRVRRWLE
ncbi:hypothetical protein [Sandaracinus amylolyticus]|uniref:Uncharacterized protein n=1 Tax=Sandaracinus amylolyticus TaxID=927083 RepID=A0A0F6W4U7_9BACT|nr:hypothetical protein [Sandaracinus amylolyticus]AKF07531.1 hypothetical protein DB32_004680 [Sandaracinus amylolyticus]